MKSGVKNNFMKNLNLKGNFKLLFAILFSLSFYSCAEENTSVIESSSEPSSLTIYIPVSHYLTRNGETMEPTGSEKEINELVLYLFNKDGSLSTDKPLILEKKESSVNDTPDYETYIVSELPSGYFYIFVTANLSDYCDLSDKITKITKIDLENAYLNFENNHPEAGNLPMVYMSEDDPVYSESNGLVNISGNTNITAQLTFLCTKVRLTILFEGNESFGGSVPEISQNPSISNIIFKTPIKSEIISETPIFDENERSFELEKNEWIFELEKYAYPEDYPYSEGNQPYADLTEKAKEGATKFIWQGIIYVPENITDKPSILTVSLQYNGVESTKTYELGKIKDEPDLPAKIKRGDMYDITLSLEDLSAFEYTYRIYWPVNCKTGLFIYDIDEFPYDDFSSDEKWDDKWRNQWNEDMHLGKEDQKIMDYYYVDIDKKFGINNQLKLLFNNLKGLGYNDKGNLSKSSNIFNLNNFKEVKINNRTYKVAVVKTDYYKNPEVCYEDPFSITYSDLIFFNWNTNIKIGGDLTSYIKIGTENWSSDFNQGKILDNSNYKSCYIRYEGLIPTYRLNYIFATSKLGTIQSDERYNYVYDENIEFNVQDNGERVWKFTIDEL